MEPKLSTKNIIVIAVVAMFMTLASCEVGNAHELPPNTLKETVMKDIPACRLPNITMLWLHDLLSNQCDASRDTPPSGNDVHVAALMDKLFGDERHEISDHDLTMQVALLKTLVAPPLQLIEELETLAEEPDKLDIDPGQLGV